MGQDMSVISSTKRSRYECNAGKNGLLSGRLLGSNLFSGTSTNFWIFKNSVFSFENFLIFQLDQGEMSMYSEYWKEFIVH